MNESRKEADNVVDLINKNLEEFVNKKTSP